VSAITWAGVHTARSDAMVAMLRDVLHVPVERAVPGATWFRLSSGDAVHVYGPPDEEHVAFGTAPVVGFLVPDHDRSRLALEEAGVELLGPPQRRDGSVWSHFRGPDGNRYQVIERPGGGTPPPGSIAAAIRAEASLVAVVAAYVAGWSVYGWLAGTRATVPYLVTMVVLSAVVAWVHVRVGLSRGVLWTIAAWGFAHMAGGLVAVGEGVLYNASLGAPLLRYDRVVHAVGFGTAAVACWQALRSIDPTVPLTAGVAVLIASMGMGVGAMNEVVEFFASRTFAANVGGYVNTGWDLVANAIGCIVASSALFLRARATPASPV
jgi:hypothetical protein